MSINNPLNPLNLSNGTYFIRTSDTQNPYLGIRGLDDIVSKGVFSFLLNGSTYLQQGSDIQFEAIDSQGNQISIGGVRNLLKGTSRVVSFEIDDRISNGEATLYISTNLSSYLDNGIETDVPSQFVDVPNLLFEYKFQVDKSRVNTDEIIFRKPPTLTVTPSLKTVRDITKTSTTTSTLSGDIKQYYYDDSSASYTLLIESESGTYSFDMNGGVATISNNVDLTIQGIVNVIDSSTIFTTIQNPDIEVYSKEQFKGILSSPVSFTISYITIPDISDTRLQETAIAGIEINDMGVVSGDVAKIKIFGKSDSLNSNYVLLSEVDVENKNLLELEGTGSVGIFDTSKKVGAWSVSKEQVSATNPTIASNDDIFLSGLVINGDYDSPTTVEINGRTLQTPRYVLESDINLQLKKNIEYNLRLNASVSDVSATDTRLDVYVKGSNFTSDNKFGKLVHSFRTDSDKIWRDQFSIVFSVDANTTDGELVFVTTSGRWYVQNIRLTANIQDGFSPQEFRTEIPLNITKPNQDIDFKVEFFDANNNKAEKVLTKDNVIFERPNIVVEGQKNVTVGEMYLGQDSNSGVVTGGSGNGGIVKSFGYEGFAESTGVDGVAGFLMYSGSVLTGSATTYQGVGLELVASSESFFRYRTNPSELDIRTNKFFIGQEATQFISGAESNIEISSSLFHLDPKNNLLVIGTDAIINADLTVNEIRTPALIGGSPSTTANASSSINSDGFAKFVSASIGGFDVSSDVIGGDGYYISGSATGNDFFISSSNFNVKANGDITGSQVLFTGGKITGSNITFDVENFIAKGNNVEISGSNFHLLEGNITASNVDLTGNISANTGNIGNFQIIDGKISGSNITLDANNSTIFKTDQGPGSDPQSPGFEYLADEYYIDFTPVDEDPDNFFVKFGPNFMVDKDGILIASGATFEGTITASAGKLGGFNIGDDSIFADGNNIFISGSPSLTDFFISSSNFNVKGNGDITGSNVLFTGGKITGSNITFDVTDFVAKGDSVEISGSNFHLLDGNITASNVDLSGTITANAGEIGGFTISQDALSSNNFFLSGSATGDDFFISASNMNVKADGQITGSEVLFTGGKVGGFTITDTLITASNLEISSDGTIQTPNFADGVRGFQITAAGNGSAQFENVKIRGTLRTTVFEKETVNAVGGQLWVANSTVLSQSVTSGETTMSVENVTGFEVDEILLIKKVDGTGFSSEYVLVESSSRTDGASDTNLSGELYVQRAYADGLPTGSDVTWVTELASSAQNYSDGQVIVSTGKEDTGWILLNASPNNTYTPYIDIVERTGSGVYDYELKARLGDLSGLSTTRLLGNNPATAGFGLYSENVFLEGGIRATFGEIGGFSITDTAISSSNDNLILRSNGQITGSAFLLGDITKTGNYIQYDGGNLVVNGTINIVGGNAATTDYVNTVSQSLTSSITTVSSSAASDLTSTSSSINTTITNVSESLSSSLSDTSSSLASDLTSTSSSLASDLTSASSSLSSDIVTNASKIVTDANAKIVKPIPAPSAGAGLYLTSTEMGFYNNSDFTAFISSSGDFLFKKDDDNLISFGNDSFILNVSDQATISGSNINLLTPTFFFGTDEPGQVNYISGSDGNLEISSSNFVIDENGNVTVSGDITITSGDLAGIDANTISGSFTEVSESIDSTITSNSSSIAGDLTTTSSSINTTITNVSESLSSSLSDASSSLASDLTTTSSSLASDLTSTSSSLATDISSNSDRIVTDADNKIIKPNDTPSGGSGLYLSERYLGYYNSSNWNAYISSSGEFLFKKDDDNQISFGNNSFILKVTDEATISGSEINLVTPTFFFGDDTPGNVNYISGSNGNLEISSSNFVIDENGDVTVSGTVTITGGDLAGIDATTISGSFTEVSESIDSTITSVSSSLSSSLSDVSQSLSSSLSGVSGSLATNVSTNAGNITTNSNKIVTDADSKIVKPITMTGKGAGLYLNSTNMGYWNGTSWNAYIENDGDFLFKADDDNLVSFNGTAFILKVSDQATISGSQINLVTPTFFFGTDTPGNVNYISGSNNNLEISSSNFVLAQNGDVTVSGDITITAGDLAGIDANTISGSFTEVSESIDSTITNVSESLSSSLSEVSSSLSSSLSNVSSSAASDITTNSSNITTNSNKIVTDANAKIVKPIVTPSSTGLFLTAQHLGYYSSSDGWNAYISSSGEFLFKADDNNLVSFASDGFVLKTETATISGSSVNLVTPTFFFGTDEPGQVNYISGSNNNLEISSSNFELNEDGSVRVSGEITITSGDLAGVTTTTISGSFTEVSESIDSTITSVSESLSSSLSDVSQSLSSSLSGVSGSLATDVSTNSSNITTNADKIVTDANNKIVKPNDAPATGNGLYLSSNYLGYYSSSGDWNAYISSSGEFLFRADDNNLVSFADDGFVLKTETATISGSSVNLVTPTFFFGTDTPGNINYISGSNNNLEISSSNFELNEDGSVRVSGEITITSGDLAGIDANTISGSFTEVSESIDGTISNVSESLSSSLSDVSQSLSSSLSSVSGSLATDVSTNAGNITTNASKIVTDANNKIVVPNDTPTGAGLFLSERYLGYYNNSDWTAYISSSGEFLFKEDDNNLVSFGEDGFVLKTETATISGSEINLVTPTFFFGTDTPGSVNYISGSNSNLEISSSNFVLAQNGDVSVSGEINATSGIFDGVSIQEAFISDVIEIDGAGKLTNPTEGFIISGSGIFLKGGINSIGNAAPNTVNFVKTDGTLAHQIRGGDSQAVDFWVESITGSVNIKSYGTNAQGNDEGVNISTVNGDIELQSPTDIQSSLTISGITTDDTETYAVMIDNSTGVVSKRELGTNAFNSDTIGTTTNALTVGTGLDLDSGTTFDGSSARTISLALGERTDNPTTSNAVLTNDGDGTITAEANLTYDNNNLTNTNGAFIVDRPTTNFAIFTATDSNDYGIQMGLSGQGNLYMAPQTGSGNVFYDNFRYNSGSSANGNIGNWQFRTGLEVGDVTATPARGEIHATGDIIGFASSDERLKENVYKLTGSLDSIDKIEGVSFDWKEFDGKEHIHSNTGKDIGVIAQQVEIVLPEIVQTRENGYKAVKYEKLVPLLVEGIKELRQENRQLKQQLNELKEKIDELL